MNINSLTIQSQKFSISKIVKSLIENYATLSQTKFNRYILLKI